MLVDGRWVPTFPNARYLIAEQEWRYWDAHEDESQYGAVLADSVRPVIDAGLVDFVSMGHHVCATKCGWSLRRATRPGHVSVTSRRTDARR